MSEPERPPAPASGTHTEGIEVDAERAAEFKAFYREHTKPLVAVLLVQGASLYDAADAVQDTMTTAFQRWRSIDNPRAWAYRVASRAWIRKVSTVREEAVAEPPEPHNPLLRSTAVEHWEQHQDIVRTLAPLPPRQRQVMAWIFFGYTPAEIADELRMTPEAVRSSLYQARRALAAHPTGTEDDQ
jgi:RNA polymerase sigma factor (sigma-70 family)